MPASAMPPLSFGHVELPPFECRQVVQHWKMVEPPRSIFRSIELVGSEYFMVTRFLDEDGVLDGGTHGLELKRVDYNEYRLMNGGSMFYRITELGDLLGFDLDESVPTMRCVPIPELPESVAK